MEKDCDNNISANIVGMNEHQIFVALLSKYKVLLGKEKRTSKRKVEAAKALAGEYNKECGKKFTVDRIYKKICNMKARLKEKNYKNLSRTKKLFYTDWETGFLDMWVGNDRTVLPRKLNKSSDVDNKAESITSEEVIVKMEKPVNLFDETSQPISTITSQDIAMKLEPDEYQVQDSSYQMSTVTSAAPVREIDSESETESEDNGGDKYASLSLDELKHAALVAQIESLKAQKAAARAKKKLNVYKLSVLRQRNGDQ